MASGNDVKILGDKTENGESDVMSGRAQTLPWDGDILPMTKGVRMM